MATTGPVDIFPKAPESVGACRFILRGAAGRKELHHFRLSYTNGYLQEGTLQWTPIDGCFWE